MNTMQQITQYILRSTMEGRIDREMGVQILKRLTAKREQTEIAIIGMECTFAQARNRGEFWQQLMTGRASIRSLPLARAHQVEDALGIPRSIGSADYFSPMGYLDQIDEFDAAFFRISPKEALAMDPKQRIFLQVLYGAVEDAGYAGAGFTGSRTGVFVGVNHLNDMEFPYKTFTDGSGMVAQTGSMPGLLAGRASYLFDLGGPAVVFDTACSSSLVALQAACESLHKGECEMAVAGGVNVSIYARGETKFDSVEAADSQVRTFDRGAHGTNWAEGAGAVLLKPLEKAITDGDHIYAVVKSVAANNDGATNGVIAPSAAAQERVLVDAWQQAKIDPVELGYIEAHGIGTLVGDQIELKGLTSAFRKYTGNRQFCALGSLKPNIGHAVGASGIAALIKVALAMENRTLPPSVNFEEPNPAINFAESPVYIVDRPTRWQPDGGPLLAGVSSFGFAGTNCHAVLASPPVPERISASPVPELFTISTHDGTLGAELVDRHLDYLEANTEVDLGDLCYSVNSGRRLSKWRLALVVRDREDLRSQLADAAARITAGDNPFRAGEWPQRDDVQAMTDAIETYLASERGDVAALAEIARRYVGGVDPDWAVFYQGTQRRRLALPTSPLLRTSYWASDMAKRRSSSGDSCQLSVPVWELADSVTPDSEPKRWLVLHEGGLLDRRLVGSLMDAGHEVTEVVGAAGQACGAETLVVEPSNTKQLSAALAQVKKDRAPQRIVYLWSLHPGLDRDRHYLGLLRLLRVVGRDCAGATLTVVTAGTSLAGSQPASVPAGALAAGATLVAAHEFPELHCRQVDIGAETIAAPSELAVTQLLAEAAASDHRRVVYSGPTRMVPGVREVAADPAGPPVIKPGGLYLITGGLGGIGAALATALVQDFGARVVLTGTSELPAETQWPGLLRAEDTAQGLRSRLQLLTKLRSRGRTAEYHQVRIEDRDQMAALVADCQARLGRFDGVFHLAGVSTGGMIELIDEQRSLLPLDAKVAGTLTLAEVFSGQELDFMMLFSSIMSLVGPASMVSYAAACAFQDAFAATDPGLGFRVISVNWDAWHDVGMLTRVQHTDRVAAVVQEAMGEGISSQQGIQAIVDILAGSGTRYLVTGRPAQRMLTDLDRLSALRDASEMDQPDTVAFDRPDLSTAYVEPSSEIEHVVAAVWQHVFSIRQIGVDDNFYELGGDSLMALTITSALSKQYGMEVTDLFTYPTVRELAGYLGGRQRDLRGEFDAAKQWLRDRPKEFDRPGTAYVQRRLADYRARIVRLDVVAEPQFPYTDVLLLGATGFVGSYLLHELLEQTSAKLHMIVRPGQVPVWERLVASHRRFFPDVDLDKHQERLNVVAGDVKQPRFGLSHAEYQRLAEQVDAICNCAGRVDHYGDIEDFRASNVAPVRQLIEFARTGRDKHIHQASTIATRGSVSERDEIYTEFDRDLGQEPLNVYAQTKAEAEALLAQAEGVRTNNYRLGYVCGDSRTGSFQKAIDKNGLYLILRALYEMAQLPTTDIGFWEFTTVDQIAKQWIAIMSHPELLDNTFHLLNGHSVGISQLKRAFRAIGRNHPEVDSDSFMDYMYDNYEGTPTSQYVRDFLLHSHLLAAPGLSRMAVQTGWTTAVLEKLDLAYEPTTVEDLVILFRYCQQEGFFSPP